MLPGVGNAWGQALKKMNHILPVTPMIHDTTLGRVTPSTLTGVSVDYSMNDHDRSQLSLGIREAAKILFAAGANQVLVPTHQGLWIHSPEDPALSSFQYQPGSIDTVSVHPMGTLKMGINPDHSVVDPNGKVHGYGNLYVADASLFRTSIGVPPQITTYAFGSRVGVKIAES